MLGQHSITEQHPRLRVDMLVVSAVRAEGCSGNKWTCLTETFWRLRRPSVLVNFVSLTQPGVMGEKKSQLRNCLDQVGISVRDLLD